ncbi:hypothetical protein [Rufibacter tibetensis]|uniref:Uncharacterized protein n=1 Tax=Rufibacter tibetensis TaxID=512763 RepID=A0A0N7HXC8_9BACT|nr:hypothetical protein [Rufibacter tibetensis]ALJ01689.1 hypothetical protein DC20_21795 [Rufibacter tibetensis]
METPEKTPLPNKMIAETYHFLAAQQEYMTQRIEASLERKSYRKEQRERRYKERKGKPKGKRYEGS